MEFTPEMETVPSLIKKITLTPSLHPLPFMFAGKAWMDKWDRGGEAWEGCRKEVFPFVMGCFFAGG